MATNFLELATTLKYLGAKWLPGKKVNFTPCSCHLLVNENLFSYEGMSTRACFEKEAKGNLEMAYDDLKTK